MGKVEENKDFRDNCSAVIEDKFLSSTYRVKLHPDGDNCRQNNGQEINAVMF